LEALKTPRSSEQISHNQECPPIADHLQRFGDRTGLIITFWHKSLLIPLGQGNIESRAIWIALLARVFAAMRCFLSQVLCLAYQPGQTIVIWRRLQSTLTRLARR
jgi:hypothetical protein